MQRLLGEPEPVINDSLAEVRRKVAAGVDPMQALIESGQVGRIAKGRHLK